MRHNGMINLDGSLSILCIARSQAAVAIKLQSLVDVARLLRLGDPHGPPQRTETCPRWALHRCWVERQAEMGIVRTGSRKGLCKANQDRRLSPCIRWSVSEVSSARPNLQARGIERSPKLIHRSPALAYLGRPHSSETCDERSRIYVREQWRCWQRTGWHWWVYAADGRRTAPRDCWASH